MVDLAGPLLGGFSQGAAVERSAGNQVLAMGELQRRIQEQQIEEARTARINSALDAMYEQERARAIPQPQMASQPYVRGQGPVLDPSQQTPNHPHQPGSFNFGGTQYGAPGVGPEVAQDVALFKSLPTPQLKAAELERAREDWGKIKQRTTASKALRAMGATDEEHAAAMALYEMPEGMRSWAGKNIGAADGVGPAALDIQTAFDLPPDVAQAYSNLGQIPNTNDPLIYQRRQNIERAGWTAAGTIVQMIQQGRPVTQQQMREIILQTNAAFGVQLTEPEVQETGAKIVQQLQAQGEQSPVASEVVAPQVGGQQGAPLPAPLDALMGELPLARQAAGQQSVFAAPGAQMQAPPGLAGQIGQQQQMGQQWAALPLQDRRRQYVRSLLQRGMDLQSAAAKAKADIPQ